jgi:hypothetical protein
MTEDVAERRSEPRDYVDAYYSVEFSIHANPFTFQFKIWNLSSKGMCILVRNDSGLLEHLKVGDVVKMKYYKTGASPAGKAYRSRQTTEHLKTEIRHISAHDEKHCFVGLQILEGSGR